VGEADEGGVVVDGTAKLADVHAFDRVARKETKLKASRRSKTLEHIAVGGKVLPVGDDHLAAGPGINRCASQLVEIDGGGVGDDHLAGACPEDSRAEAIADIARQLVPVLPTFDKPVAPLFDRGGQADHGRTGEAAQ